MAQESRLVIVIDAKNAERNARNLSNELDSIERKGDFATKSMDALSVATRQLAGYMAGLVTVSAAISKMDTYTGLQNRLKLVTNNQVELNKATEDTFRIAQKTYSAWDSVLQVYQRFSDNAKTLNLTMDDTARLTETVSKAVAISGASASAADAALVQFGQALASGTLRGEELNSVMEQTPALAKAIAQGMGITVGELRSVAAEGKITSQEIVKALRNVEKDVDALFAKTDITIGQSLTLLNNEITKFVGESGKGSGAAQVLAGTIQTLASNLDVLTSAMMVGGAYWLGTYIPAIYASGVAVVAKTKELVAQTVTQYAAIQAERAAAAQQVISTQAVVANTQATLAAIAAEKALEVQRLKSQITEKGRTATLTRMAELKKIEAQVTRELALAEEALAVAQSRSAAAGAASVGIGSRLLGLLGRPVGIGITVASLAAGYLLMRDNTAEANKKLEEQAEVANQAAEELRKLHGVEKQSAINDMTAALEAQNKALRDAELAAGAALIDIQNFAQGNVEVTKISNEARLGTISYTEALRRLNGMSIPPDLYNALKKQVEGYDQAYFAGVKLVDGLKAVGREAKLQGNAAQNAANQNNIHANSLDSVAGAANNATNALSDYLKKLQQSTFKTELTNKLIGNYGFDPERAKAFAEAYVQNGNKISARDAKIIDQNLAANRKLQASEEAVAQARRNSAAAARKANREATKEANEAKRLFEEQARLRDQFADSYAPKLTQIENDLQRELTEIRKANFGNEEKDYIAKATARAELNKELYLRELTYEINQFHWSEEQKLKYSYETKQMQIKEGTELTDDLKQIRLDALKQEYDQEVGIIQLAQEQRLFQAKQALLTETQTIQERYRLEREEILKNTKLSIEERQKLISLSKANQDKETRDKVNNAVQNWGGIQASITGNSGQFALEQERFSRYDASQKVFDSQLADIETQEQDPNANMVALNAQREQIMKEHFERLKLIESTYQNDSLNLQLSQAQAVTGAFTGMFGAILGESSTAYKTLFATQKAFALAQAGMNVWKAASDAYANAQGTVWNKLAEAAIATAKSSSFVTLIQAATPQGFADGGYTGNGLKHTPAGIVHKGEVVWSQEDIKRWGGVSVVESMRQSKPSGYANGGYVSNNTSEAIATRREARQFDAINSGRIEKSQPTVTIINQTSEKVDATSEWDGKELTVILKEYQKQNEAMVDAKIEKRFRMSKRQGW
ncbi:tape measure protein [Acinetobacter baumannii]|nr:tape measure protein [Acinetobacter baumannii]MDO7406386.1 tape measure protein [Acinetobacter baumannii]